MCVLNWTLLPRFFIVFGDSVIYPVIHFRSLYIFFVILPLRPSLNHQIMLIYCPSSLEFFPPSFQSLLPMFLLRLTLILILSDCNRLLIGLQNSKNVMLFKSTLLRFGQSCICKAQVCKPQVVSQIRPALYFCMTYKQKIFFTFLSGF